MNRRSLRRTASSILAAGCLFLGLAFCSPASAQTTKPALKFDKFDFGTGAAKAGYVKVQPDTAYTDARGYGIEPGAPAKAVDRGSTGGQKGDFITSDKPIVFSVAAPEGSYQVTVTLGDPQGESKTTIKAELRRLMVEKAHLDKLQIATYTFNVNIRTPQIPGGGTVRLKDREKQGEVRAWDNKLTLEFDDALPCIQTVELKRVDNLPVVFVVGDSTVCDQPGEAYASWGQMLPRFLKPDVVVANHAESGESLRGFLGEQRWAKVMSQLKPGDYVIIQMGHNDEKEGRDLALTSFKTDLKRFVADTRSKGATAIIVPPMERRNFDANGKITASHGQYPEAYYQVAREDKVAMIDLTAASVVFYNTLGKDKAFLAFASTPAMGAERDKTHHDPYGAYELAKIIIQGIRDNKLELAKSIVDDFKGFDPAHPDNVDTFTMPIGPSTVNGRPLGS